MANNSNKSRKRILVAVGAGVAVAAVALASAAGLGGIIVEQIGAENTVVADPFTDGVTVTWGEPAYDSASKEYLVDEFTVSRNGEEALPAGDLRVTIAEADGTVLTEASATTDGTASDQVFTLEDGISAHGVENLAVVLHNVTDTVVVP